MIYDTETAIRARSAALLRILERFKNVRGPITEHVFTYARRKMPGGFAFHALLTVSSDYCVSVISNGNNNGLRK